MIGASITLSPLRQGVMSWGGVALELVTLMAVEVVIAVNVATATYGEDGEADDE